MKHKIIFTSLLFFAFTGSLSAQNISLTAELDSDSVWLGDSVQLTLYLQGSEEPIAPTLVIPDIRVEPLGGTTRSSRSISNINGKVTETVRKAYVYGYELTPLKAGSIIIPAVAVNAEGRQLSSRELRLDVKQPEFSDDFILDLDFDRSRIYLNEECRLEVSFFYSKSLRSLDISIPGIEGFEYAGGPATSNNERYEISINGSPVVFSRNDKSDVAGLSAVLVFRPDSAGIINLSNSSASFESVTGYKRVQDFFGRVQNQEIYGRSVVPGSSSGIEVLPFPESSKPDDFFGLSGNVEIKLSAEPVDAHIGDPITLTLELEGLNNTDVVIPPLAEYLGDGIDIPDTRSKAKTEGNRKIITQTVRINNPAVSEIPAVKLSYFNTSTETYETAESAAVPVRVLETKIVTSKELEGADTPGEEQKIMLEKKREGIYYNYSGKQLLVSRSSGIEGIRNSLFIKILLLIPPAVFLLVLIFTAVLPQLRARAAKRADRGRALRLLKRSISKADSIDADDYLKMFNGKFTDFLKTHGRPGDEDKLSEARMRMNGVIYGKESIDLTQARELTSRIIQLLGEKEDRA